MLFHEGKGGSGLSELGNSLFLETPSEKLYVLGLKFLQEFENQVTQLHPQRLVVVADDVCGVLLDLNEGFCLLEEDDVALGCVFHLHVTETMLGTALGSKKEMLQQLRQTEMKARGTGRRKGEEHLQNAVWHCRYPRSLGSAEETLTG